MQAGDSERRRLERNLHDGAQQRLLALSFSLGLAETQPPDGSPEAAKLAHEPNRRWSRPSRSYASSPAGSTPRSSPTAALRVALQSVAARSPMPVDALRRPRAAPRADRDRRLLPRLRSDRQRDQAPKAKRVDVTIARRNGHVVVEVADDGVGGASARAGSGLRGLVDRVEALDGTLFVTSPAGAADHDPGGDPVRVVVADDSVLLREGLVHILTAAGFDVVGQAGTADELMLKVRSYNPDIAIIDIRMPPTHTDEGLQAAKAIREQHPNVAVLVLSQYVELGYATELLGARHRARRLPAQGPRLRRRRIRRQRATRRRRRLRARPRRRLAARRQPHG